jgi:hypothetical protein
VSAPAVKVFRVLAEEGCMRRILRGAVPAALATLVLAGCAASSGSAGASADDSSLATPRPANPTLASAMITPKDLGDGWKYLFVKGADGLPPHSCDTGAAAAAKVGVQSGDHVVVEDGTLFDSADNASGFMKRGALAQDCARSATASPAVVTSLGLPPVGDESFSLKVQGSTCSQIVLIRKGVIVVELVMPCAETTSAVTSYSSAAVRALTG